MSMVHLNILANQDKINISWMFILNKMSKNLVYDICVCILLLLQSCKHRLTTVFLYLKSKY